MASLPYVGPAAVGGLLAKYVSPLTGLVGLAVSVLVVVLLRKPREGRFVLRVEGDVLEVRREKRPDPIARVALADIVDVTLDRQAHQGGSRGGAAAERTRIALERRGEEEPVYVPDERVTSIEAQEWHGKIRVFLRKHGWLPEDERATA